MVDEFRAHWEQIIWFVYTHPLFADESTKYNTNNLIDSLRIFLKETHRTADFIEMKYYPRGLILKPRLVVLHKQSNIECVLIAEDMSMVKVANVINKYMDIEPMCEY